MAVLNPDDGFYHLYEPGRGTSCGNAPDCWSALNWASPSPGTWTVTLADGTAFIPRDAVPTDVRCRECNKYWPKPVGELEPYQRIRARLVDDFGSRCAACQDALACVVDHDPVGGLVRGYLCLDCNAKVETCLHAAGCRFADYLNAPPAFALHLPYPRKSLRPNQKAHLDRVNELIAAEPEFMKILRAVRRGDMP